MFLTYGFTVVIVGAWLLRMVNRKSLIFNRTPLDLPLLLFLGANILSTIFSIDTHTSVWGYYSRLNGGLLSIISYTLLYWAFVSNMDKEKVFTGLKFALASGVIVALWGILEHFGVSPSCLILRGEFSASCWIQDVQARVFATLGQPNWMAGYLAMLIFPALYFYLTAKTFAFRTTYYLLLTTLYLAFTFTYSRGPTLGLIGGFIIFVAIFLTNFKKIAFVLLAFLFINILFGSALTSFRLVSQFAPPPRPGIALPSSGTQLETGGTESGQIRFIVWRGAWDIFKNYPIFGSGLETFAYSYYQFRPAEHNLTSEWDFLYNKAHNEYLNYLATTGIVGFGTYLLVVGTFLIWTFKKLNSSFLILIALLASYISYLIYNFFLFSVVILALFFYLFPALAFVAADATKVFKWPKKLYALRFMLYAILYRRPLYTNITKGLVIFSTFYLLFSIFQLWYADTLFAKAEKYSDLGNAGKAYNLLASAAELNKFEPLYHSELGFVAAQAAEALMETDATLSADLKNQAVNQTRQVLQQSPNNVSYLRTAVRTYAQLADLDSKFLEDAVLVLDKATALAPTDPKLYYNKGLIWLQIGKEEEASVSFKKALELKPNYLEAIEELNELKK